MAELSKTARASMKAGMGQEKKETNKITPEEAIRQVRMNLAGNLHNPSHLIEALLNEFDSLVYENKVLEDKCEKALKVQLDE